MTAKPPPMNEAAHRRAVAHWQNVAAKQSEAGKSAREEEDGWDKYLSSEFKKREQVEYARASQKVARQRKENAYDAALQAHRKAAAHLAAADSIAAPPPPPVPKPKGWFHKATGYSFRRMAKRKEGGRATRRASRRRRTRRHKRRRTKRRRRTRHRTNRRRRHRTSHRRRRR